MKTAITAFLLTAATTFTAASCAAPQVDENSLAAGQQQIVVQNDATPFTKCPPTLPVDCEIAVLEGSPKSDGELFTVRFRMTKPWTMPPHSHPRNERVTIISGNANVGFGDTVDRANSKRFGAGDYYVNAAGASHYVWSDEPVVLQITGIGPWEVHPAGKH